jgi:hypothetical protein
MIRHILKIIWTQRKSNGWIYAELLVVVGAIWYMTDKLYVDLRTWYSPLGYDITDTWRFKLSKLNASSPAYVPEEEYTSTPTEDLLQLSAQIRRLPAVEEVCFTFYSCPYSFGNSSRSITPVDGDTLAASQKSFQVRRVSAEYFDVFRVRDTQGRRLNPVKDGVDNPVILTRDMADVLYPGQPAEGRKVRFCTGCPELPVTAVSVPVRTDEYLKSEPSFFLVMTGGYLQETVESFGPENAELCVRMKRAFTLEEMHRFMEETGEQLTANNLHVYGVRSIADAREDMLYERNAEQSKQFCLMAFLLVNVLFGITGTFRLRIQQRRGETGIRMALGANRLHLAGYLYGEGLCLLLLTLPFTALFAVNIIMADIPDSYRLPYTVGRFLLTFGGTYLLMGLMICTGIRFPARKAARIAPAEALHYE